MDSRNPIADQPRAEIGPDDLPEGADPAVASRILDAAFLAASSHGIRRLSMSDVAEQAALSRPTLYKHVGNLDAIVAATVQREMLRATELAVTQMASEADPFLALEQAITALLRLTREHPLLDRLLRTEPETLLPVLTDDGGPAIRTMRTRIEAQLTTRFPEIDPVVARRGADAMLRLLISYAISAPDDPPEVVAQAVAVMLVAGIAEMQRLADAGQLIHQAQEASP